MKYQLLIKNGLCVNSNGSFEADLAIAEGKIAQIGANLELDAEKVIDARGKLVLPGVIDTHVHLPWPSSSFDSVDNYASGTAAAACGGVTTIIEYVVPDESGRILPALEERLASTPGVAQVDYSFHLILRKVLPQTLADMAEAARQGFTSFKIYTAYSGFRLGDDEILTALTAAKELGVLLCFHAEDGLLVNFASEQLAKAGKTHIRYYPEAHPRLADIEATQRVIAYARYTGARIHIVHVNTWEGAKMIGKARRSGLPITGETCPHYLMFTEDAYKSGKPEANYFVLSPVIRADEDRQALWKAIEMDDLQTIATDHCPYNSQQKLKNGADFRYIPGGAGGVETSLPIIYSYGVKTGRISLPRMVELMSANPARIFNLYPRKGAIAAGSDADLVIYDPAGTAPIDYRKLHSNTDHTLFEGIEVSGKVQTTILGGNIVAENGQVVAPKPLGQLLRRPGYQAMTP